MKILMVSTALLLSVTIAQAEIVQLNKDGIDFYLNQFPEQITYLTSSSQSSHPIVCTIKDPDRQIVNCSFDLESSYYYSSTLTGKVSFRTYDKSKYCNYDLYTSISNGASAAKIQVTNLLENGMNCERYSDGSKYNVNY